MEHLTYWEYVKAAFSRGHKVPLLGRMPVNQMLLVVFGALGVLNPGFWLVGAAAEVGYLALLSSNSRFQKLVQGDRLLNSQEEYDEKIQRAARALHLDARERYRRLLSECNLILGIAPDADEREKSEVGAIADLRAGSLNSLLALFLRLLTSQQLIRANLEQLDQASLEQYLERLQKRLAGEEKDSPLARSLAATVEIQQKRLANLRRAHSSLALIEAELDRIEGQVRLIREETAVSGGPEALSARLDAVTQTLSETSRWMDQNAELLGGLATDLLDAEATALPRLEEEPPPEDETPPRKGRRGDRERE